MALLSFCILLGSGSSAGIGDDSCIDPKCVPQGEDEFYNDACLSNPHSTLTEHPSRSLFPPEILGLVQNAAGNWNDPEIDSGDCATENDQAGCYNCASISDFGTDFAIDGGLMLIGSPNATYRDSSGFNESRGWESAISIVSMETNDSETIKGFRPGAMMAGSSGSTQLEANYDVTYRDCDIPVVTDGSRNADPFESVFAGFYKQVLAQVFDEDGDPLCDSNGCRSVFITNLGRALAIERINADQTVGAFGFLVRGYGSGSTTIQTITAVVALVPIELCDEGPRFDTENALLLQMPADGDGALDPTFSLGLSIAMREGKLLVGAPKAGTQRLKDNQDHPDDVGADQPRRGRVFQYEYDIDSNNGITASYTQSFKPFDLPGQDGDVQNDDCPGCNFDPPDLNCAADFYNDMNKTGILSEFENDYFGGDLDFSGGGRMVAIGAPFTMQQHIPGALACNGCHDIHEREWFPCGGAVYVVDLQYPDADPYLMFNPDSVVGGSIESIFDCGCPPSHEAIGQCFEKIKASDRGSWRNISRFFLQADFFGSSVSITCVNTRDARYRVAGSIPGDIGWVESACLDCEPSCPSVDCPDPESDGDLSSIDNLDLGTETSRCAAHTGGLVLFEFDADDLRDRADASIDPYTGSPLLTDDLVDR